MEQDNKLASVTAKLGRGGAAAAATPVVMTADAIGALMSPMLTALNPSNIAKSISDQTGLSSIKDTYSKIYDKINQKRDNSDTKGATGVKLQIQGVETRLDLILDVLMKQYSLDVDKLKGAKREENFNSFQAIEDQREKLKNKSKQPDATVVEATNPFTRFIGMFSGIPAWLTKGILIAGGGSVATLASYFEFDKILIAWRGINETILSGSRLLTSGIKTVSASLSSFEPIQKGFIAIKEFFTVFKGTFSSIAKIAAPIVKSLGFLVSRFGAFAKYLTGPFVLGFLALFDFTEGFIKGFKDGDWVKGLKAGLLNVFEGFVLEPIELVKDLVSWAASKLNFSNFSGTLDGFDVKDEFYSMTDSVKSFVNNTYSKAKLAITSGINFGMSDINNIVFGDLDLSTSTNNLINEAKASIAGNFDTMMASMDMAGSVNSLLNSGKEGLTQGWESISKTFSDGMVANISSIAFDILSSAKEKFNFETIKEQFGDFKLDFNIKDELKGIASAISDFVFDSFKQAKENLKNTALSLFGLGSTSNVSNIENDYTVNNDSTVSKINNSKVNNFLNNKEVKILNKSIEISKQEKLATPSVSTISNLEKSSSVHNIVNKSSEFNNKSGGTAAIYLDQRQENNYAAASSGSADNGSRTVPVSTETKKSFVERREFVPAGYGGGW